MDEKANDRFSKRIILTQDILSVITRIDECKGFWRGNSRLNPQVMSRLKSWVIITSTGASTRIEGSAMTDEQIARFLRGLHQQPPKSRDEQEVAGYADLIGRVFDNFATISLSENWILQFHAILLHFSEKDVSHRGKYKTGNNTVVMVRPDGTQTILFDPTPPYLVKPEMEAIIQWTNECLKKGSPHPLLVIANCIFEFLAIHPFKDGNGRVSRALTNLLLLKAGYTYIPYVSLDEIIEETRSDYYLALRSTQKWHKSEHEDITPWLTYFLKALLEQTHRARRLMENQGAEKGLSSNQLRILAFFEPGVELSVSDIDRLLQQAIPKPTIKQILSRLLDLHLIERLGSGRATRYTIKKTS